LFRTISVVACVDIFKNGQVSVAIPVKDCVNLDT
jgi:hypothetical protein